MPNPAHFVHDLTEFQDAVIYKGEALDILKRLPSEAVNCCITSPPYYGLRNYGVEGQLGQEETPEEYVERTVGIFHEVKRILRKDGTLWLNIGDTWAKRRVPSGNLKQKDLIGIPWMLAFALRKDGWYLRQEIIWHKPNPMVEAVQDRPTRAHEQIFLLSKSKKYYYDADAIAEPAVSAGQKRSLGPKSAGNSDRNDAKRSFVVGDKRNIRSVWTISPRPSKSAHFAAFPEELPKRCMLAGCPEGGIVLDPFSGTATTGNTGMWTENMRRYVGIELNPDHYEDSVDRLRFGGSHGRMVNETAISEELVRRNRL
jgi:DNA modification methylase